MTRQEGTSPDNEEAIRDHNYRIAGTFPVFAVVFAIIVIIAIVSLVL